MGKSTNQMAMFTRFLRVYQRVCLHFEVHLEVTISLDGSTICPSGTSPCAGGFGSPYPHAWSIGSPGVGPLVNISPGNYPGWVLDMLFLGMLILGSVFFFRAASPGIGPPNAAKWQGAMDSRSMKSPKKAHESLSMSCCFGFTLVQYPDSSRFLPFVGRKPSSGWSNCMTGSSMMIPLYPASLGQLRWGDLKPDEMLPRCHVTNMKNSCSPMVHVGVYHMTFRLFECIWMYEPYSYPNFSMSWTSLLGVIPLSQNPYYGSS